MCKGAYVNFYDEGFLANPYPVYARLRSYDPFHRSFIGATVLSRYRDVVAVLRDARFSSDVRNWTGFAGRLGRDPTVSWLLCNWIMNQDPPAHSRIRGLFREALGAAQGTPQDVMARRVDDIIEGARRRGVMDVVAEFASVAPAALIYPLFGIREEDRTKVREWARQVSTLFEPVPPLACLETAARAAERFATYLRELYTQRLADPGADVLSLLAGRVEAEEDEDLILASCIFFLSAGHETTMRLIGNGVLILLQHQEVLERLRRRPELLESCVEEIARYESPVQTIWRMATEDVLLDGHLIAAGEQVMLLLGSANRDPEQFDDPDTFDLERRHNRHLGYGFGRHTCQGAALARTAARIAIERLLRQAPDLRLRGSEPRWASSLGLRGLQSLEVEL